jgi:hypothetical protein
MPRSLPRLRRRSMEPPPSGCRRRSARGVCRRRDPRVGSSPPPALSSRGVRSSGPCCRGCASIVTEDGGASLHGHREGRGDGGIRLELRGGGEGGRERATTWIERWRRRMRRRPPREGERRLRVPGAAASPTTGRGLGGGTGRCCHRGMGGGGGGIGREGRRDGDQEGGREEHGDGRLQTG